jgi:hypothetical protein
LINLKPLLQFKQQILATILLVYHILVWSTPDPKLQFALSFILYGLFLLWQPLWDKDTQIKRLPAALGIGLFFLTLSFISPNESLLFFGLILLGLFGSRLLSQAGFRNDSDFHRVVGWHRYQPAIRCRLSRWFTADGFYRFNPDHRY